MNNIPTASSELFGILGPLIILWGILILWSIASYVISGISLFDIGKRMGIAAYGLAWVPAANVWPVGAIADKYDAQQTGKDHKFRWVLVWIMIAFVLSYIALIVMYTVDLVNVLKAVEAAEHEPEFFIDVFGAAFATILPMAIASTALTAVEYICFYKIFELCKPDKPLKNLLIAILVPFAFPFVRLSCRKALEIKIDASFPELPEMQV